MKLIDKYNELKKDYINHIIFIKSGVFIVTFDDDANIISELFNYKINNNKLGFPSSSISKVENKLLEENINYIIFENDEIKEKSFNDNKYLCYKNEIKKFLFNNKMKEMLLERINYLIDDNWNNFDKIRGFIDEL